MTSGSKIVSLTRIDTMNQHPFKWPWINIIRGYWRHGAKVAKWNEGIVWPWPPWLCFHLRWEVNSCQQKSDTNRELFKVFSCKSAFSRCMLFSGILGMLVVWRQAPETEDLFNPLVPEFTEALSAQESSPKQTPTGWRTWRLSRAGNDLIRLSWLLLLQFGHPLGFTVSSSLFHSEEMVLFSWCLVKPGSTLFKLYSLTSKG